MPDQVSEPLRPSLDERNAQLLWYPLAHVLTPRMRTRGKYPDNYPRGAVVHFTAGHDESDSDAAGSISYGREQGFAYLCISPTGRVYQAHPFDEWGYHAGESNWTGLGSSVSGRLVGIEICCAGRLDSNLKSWFGKTYPIADTRTVTEANYGCPDGAYKKYTAEQESSLLALLLWLKRNNENVFSFDYVLGHHEVSGMKGIGRWRKNDPGGALSMPMDDFRSQLRQQYS